MSLGYLSDREILRLRFKDLKLRLEGGELEKAVRRLHRELQGRGLAYFRPHAWLSSEWFSADGVPGIAIPFYLAHPRLEALERAQMGEAEGDTPESLMRILRHEAGHAFLSAYRLRRRADVIEVFGPFGAKYPRRYFPRPYSRRHVRHFGDGYAQSHPDEDFAETFAVWLDPKSGWRRRYRGWKAMEKLRFIDGLARELGRKRPPVASRRRVEPLERLSRTLGRHYRARRSFYRIGTRDFSAGAVLYAPAIRRWRSELRRTVSAGTGVHQYVVERVIGEILKDCGGLEGRMKAVSPAARPTIARRLARETVRYVRDGHHYLAL